MNSKIKAYLKDENGQTSVEYILMLAVVALIVFKFKKVVSEKITEITESVFGTATDSITEELRNLN